MKKKDKTLRIRTRCWKYLSREERRTNCEEKEEEGIAPSIKDCGNYLVMSCTPKKVTGANPSSFGVRRPIRNQLANCPSLSLPAKLQTDCVMSRNTVAHKRIQTKISACPLIFAVIAM